MPEVKELIAKALGPGDIPVKLRNKLYAAMDRMMKAAEAGRKEISGAVLARFAEDKKDKNKMFFFLQEWCNDTSCGSLRVTEEHVHKSYKYSESAYMWITPPELKLRFKAYKYPEMMVYCEKLLAGSKSKKHPIHPKDNELALHRILKDIIEVGGTGDSHELKASLDADVNSSEGGRAILGGLQKRRNMVASCKGVAEASDDEERKPKGSKPKKDVPANVNGQVEISAPTVPAKVLLPRQELTFAQNRLLKLRSMVTALSSRTSAVDQSCVQALTGYQTFFEDYRKKVEDVVIGVTPESDLKAIQDYYMDQKKEGGAIRNLTEDFALAASRANKS